MFDDRKSYSHDRESSLRSVLWCLRSFAAITWPFTRRHVGSECPGSAALASLAIVVLTAMWTDTLAAWLLLWIYVLALLRLRAEWFRNRKLGFNPHRFWDGTPWLAQRLLPRIQNISRLKSYEGFILAGMGALLTYVDGPVGGLIIASGAASFCVENISLQIRMNRVSAMRDAQAEMHQTMSDYHNGF